MNGTASPPTRRDVEARWVGAVSRLVLAGGRRTGATGNVTGLELAEVELVASDAEFFDDIRDDAARHIAGMPGKGDETVRSERIVVVPVAAYRSEQLVVNFPKPPLQLAGVSGRVPAPDLGGKDEFVAERRRDGTASFQ